MFSVRKIVYASMMAAVCCVATMIHIPLPMIGYLHIGDAFVILSGVMLGFYGAFAAAIGSALADLLLSYAVYAPVTFVLKGVVALLAALLMRHIIMTRQNRPKLLQITLLFLFALVAEQVMVCGYFAFEWYWYGSINAALIGVLYNSIQGALGALIASFSAQYVMKISDLRRLFDRG